MVWNRARVLGVALLPLLGACGAEEEPKPEFTIVSKCNDTTYEPQGYSSTFEKNKDTGNWQFNTLITDFSCDPSSDSSNLASVDIEVLTPDYINVGNKIDVPDPLGLVGAVHYVATFDGCAYEGNAEGWVRFEQIVTNDPVPWAIVEIVLSIDSAIPTCADKTDPKFAFIFGYNILSNQTRSLCPSK